MKRAYLIADSGGSKTDWCLCDVLGNKHSFTTDSYHPHLVNDEWIATKKEFWKEYVQLYDLEVHFFGSGCMQEGNKQLLKNAFNNWGIHKVTIESDIIGAAYACFGKNDGFVAILGTGSVLAEIENGAVKKLYGGLGFLLGDEGSGYHFGKMLLQKYLHNQFSKEVSEEIEKVAGSRDVILASVYGASGKKYISGLSALLSSVDMDEIMSIHAENIEQFIQLYLPDVENGKRISFVGSYADYNRNNLKKSLDKRGWELGEIVKKPIVKLTEYVLESTF